MDRAQYVCDPLKGLRDTAERIEQRARKIPGDKRALFLVQHPCMYISLGTHLVKAGIPHERAHSEQELFEIYALDHERYPIVFSDMAEIYRSRKNNKTKYSLPMLKVMDPSVKVIALTNHMVKGSPDIDSETVCMLAGADGYIGIDLQNSMRKSMKTLFEIISEHLPDHKESTKIYARDYLK